MQAGAEARMVGDVKLAAMVEQNLGTIANMRGDLSSAIRHYETSLAGYRELGLDEQVGNLLNNVGMAHARLGQWQEAERTYLEALANAMREEYEMIAASGLLLQLDCPDLAMGRHTRFKNLTDDQFLRNAELQVEALNHALAKIPADRVRLHICWGNYEGSHVHDMDCMKIFPIALKAKPIALLIEAANPRH